MAAAQLIAACFAHHHHHRYAAWRLPCNVATAPLIAAAAPTFGTTHSATFFLQSFGCLCGFIEVLRRSWVAVVFFLARTATPQFVTEPSVPSSVGFPRRVCGQRWLKTLVRGVWG